MPKIKADKIHRLVTIFLGATLWLGGQALADDWADREFKVAGGGTVSLSYPLSWGKKPDYELFDTITDLQFGPYGPKSKPVFLVHLQGVLAMEKPASADLMEIARLEVENLKNTAFETDIPINNVASQTSEGVYFSITDKESKRGEFDYLTMAIVASGQLLLKVYFLSSDGAPDFGADALQMMRSIEYHPPETESGKK